MDEPITLKEVALTIRTLQSSKAPGLDEYTPKFYKTFAKEVAPLLLRPFNKSLKRGSLPATFYQTTISFSTQKGEGPTRGSILQTSDFNERGHQNFSQTVGNQIRKGTSDNNS